MSMYNSKGQINASSKRDAIAQIIKMASVLDEDLPSSQVPATFDEAEKDKLVEAALNNPEARVVLAQAMATPIRQSLDYRGILRRLLVVDAIPNGAIPAYDRDIDVTAVVVSENGAGVESRVFGERVQVPTFEIMSNPTVKIHEVKRRRFNVLDRAMQKARQEIQSIEDANGFAAIDNAAQIENVLQDINDQGLLKRDLVALKRQIDGHDLVTSKFLMNINEYTDILMWGAGGGQGLTGGELEPVSMREVLQTGLFAHIWGADILVSKIVPRGTVYAVADAEFLGVMPIVSDIEVMPADEPKQSKLGWVVQEIIGIAVMVPSGCAAGRKSVLAN